jgi:hypothetical protein
MSYGSSKISSSGSSSFLSGSGSSMFSSSSDDKSVDYGSSSGGSMPSSSASSCVCEFLIELTLEGPSDLVVTVTNIGTCMLEVYDVLVGDDTTISTVPKTLAPNEYFDFLISTSYNLSGLTGVVSTSCYNALFTVS